MPIKRLHPRQQLLVIPQRYQDLTLISDRLLEDGEGTLRDLVLLKFPDLGFVELGFRDIGVLTSKM